jgi:DNA-binding MarR family transcriptional regulator
MPSRRPTPDMPERAAAAHHAISGNGRLAALRWLLANPDSTRSEIVAGAGLTSSTAQAVLLALEELDYVQINGPTESRQGRVIRYSADRSRITKDLHELVAWTIS